jgi:hypothetical protein
MKNSFYKKKINQNQVIVYERANLVKRDAAMAIKDEKQYSV